MTIFFFVFVENIYKFIRKKKNAKVVGQPKISTSYSVFILLGIAVIKLVVELGN